MNSAACLSCNHFINLKKKLSYEVFVLVRLRKKKIKKKILEMESVVRIAKLHGSGLVNRMFSFLSYYDEFIRVFDTLKNCFRQHEETSIFLNS